MEVSRERCDPPPYAHRRVSGFFTYRRTTAVRRGASATSVPRQSRSLSWSPRRARRASVCDQRRAGSRPAARGLSGRDPRRRYRLGDPGAPPGAGTRGSCAARNHPRGEGGGKSVAAFSERKSASKQARETDREQAARAALSEKKSSIPQRVSVRRAGPAFCREREGASRQAVEGRRRWIIGRYLDTVQCLVL